jgi:hypothetical protein
MDSVIWANNALTTLASNITTSQTTIALTSGSGALFPNPGAGQFFPITIISATNNAVFEIVYCTARSGDTCTVIRAQEATTGKAFNAGDLAQNLITAGTILPPGRLLNIQGLFASGTYTETPGTNKVRVTAIGGAGAGGGAVATSSATLSVASGGAAASYGIGIFSSGFSGATVTIGAGGIGAAGAVGGNGGTTSFGSLLTAPGGGGGGIAATNTSGVIVANQGAPGAPASGANIINTAGNPGLCGFIIVGEIISGQGAGSPFGGGGNNNAGGLGGNASGFGAGGGGSANGVSAGATPGGSGSPGFVIVEEFS